MNGCYWCYMISFHSTIKQNDNVVIRQAFARYLLWLLVTSEHVDYVQHNIVYSWCYTLLLLSGILQFWIIILSDVYPILFKKYWYCLGRCSCQGYSSRCDCHLCDTCLYHDMSDVHLTHICYYCCISGKVAVVIAIIYCAIWWTI